MYELPFDARAPFTRKQALAAGITESALRGWDYQQVFWGVLHLEPDRADPRGAVARRPHGGRPQGRWSVTTPPRDCGAALRLRPG